MESVQQLNLNLYDEYDNYSNYNLNIFDTSRPNKENNANDPLQDDPFKTAFKWPQQTATGVKSSAALQFTAAMGAKDGESIYRNRPITAVKGAGYISRGSNTGFDPLNLAGQVKSAAETVASKQESLEDRIKGLEKQVMQLIDQSCLAESRGDFKLALEKAKEASSKEHSLIRLLEQNGHDDSHNLELTYCVLFTVAHQYVTNEMYTEALNMYKAITKNKVFQNGVRLKLNIGNIYAQMGMYHEALKVYRWVLDRIPASTNKVFRTKVLHNIGVVFVKMRKLEDACTNFEYVVQEKPTMSAAFHSLLCHFFCGNIHQMRKSFQSMLNVPADLVEVQTKLLHGQEDDANDVSSEVLKRDQLSAMITQRRAECEKNVITASNLISPIIEETYAAGFSWCLEIIKNCEQYAYLSGDLEINKAIAYLRHNHAPDVAIDALKSFDKREAKVASSANTNLAFIYYFSGNLDQAQSHAVEGREADIYSAVANVNMGNCAFSKGAFDKSKEFYQSALENDSSCVEALYNLGLTHKRTGHLDEALQCFTKLQMMANNHPDVLYQIAQIHEQHGDLDEAIDWYLQLLGINYSDIGVLKKIAEIFDSENDKQQAFHYYSEAYRYYPSNLAVLDWLGEYFVELRLPEKAVVYFEKAALVQPNQPKWRLLVGSCHRQSGNYQRALQVYKNVLQEFPENTDCLKLLIRIGRDLALKETADYVEKLANVERIMAQRNQYSTGAAGSGRRRAGSGSRSSSGRTNSGSINNNNNTNVNLKSVDGESRFLRKGDYEYNDPLGPISDNRPRTSATKNPSRDEEDDFGDDDLDENLLPL